MKKMHAPKIMVCSIAILSVAGCGGGCVASISCKKVHKIGLNLA